MKYLIVAIVLAALVSPFMVLKPSRRQKQIVALREEARRCGLQVQVLTQALSGSGDSNPVSVRYLLPWREKHLQQVNSSSWLLIREDNLGRGFHESSSWAGWRWHQDPALDHDQQAIARVIADFPDSIVALSGNAQGLAAYWTERGDIEQVKAIEEMLGLISQHM